MIVMADIGNLTADVEDEVAKWVRDGGIAGALRRPAARRGDRLADPGDAAPRRPRARRQPVLADAAAAGELLRQEPVRRARRFPTTCWSTARCWPSRTGRWPIAPGRRSPTARRWSPRRRAGKGWLILFHVTADTSWSNLPLSGTFVEMLRRIIAFSTGAGGSGNSGGAAQPVAALPPARRLRPLRHARRRGASRSSATPPTSSPGIEHPPGLYGSEEGFRALNLLDDKADTAGLRHRRRDQRQRARLSDRRAHRPRAVAAGARRAAAARSTPSPCCG